MEGFAYVTKDFVEYILVDRDERSEGDLFPTFKTLFTKRHFITPANAKKLLEAEQKKRHSYLTTADIEYLTERVKEYNPLKRLRKRIDTEGGQIL